MKAFGDLQVQPKGSHLQGKKIDFLVSGGIAAIESPKIIRELRRYGAEVRVILSHSADEFVRPLVFEWASSQAVVSRLSGQAEHISSADLIVVSPASLNFLGKLALGLADCPASTRSQSAIGRIPFFIQASMHQSLMESPAFEAHRKRLQAVPKVHFLDPKMEEGKAKSAQPEELVAEICHHFHERQQNILLFSGPTRSMLDDVRYLSNRSTGRLGLAIAEEAYRSGYSVSWILGPTEISIPRYLKAIRVETRQEMLAAGKNEIEKASFTARIFNAAVLDFEVSSFEAGKMSSKNKDWNISLQSTPKLIQDLVDPKAVNIGFKLEVGVSLSLLREAMRDLSNRSGCQWVVGNLLNELGSENHRAYLWKKSESDQEVSLPVGKSGIAQALIQEISIAAPKN
jgi:phosphopantothenoylcysteine decarboxylase/phosphopantothenate--cysteine ligase